MIFDGKTLKDLYADKGQSGMDLRESEDIKERWQEYTEELHKKDLHNPDAFHYTVLKILHLFILPQIIRSL